MLKKLKYIGITLLAIVMAVIAAYFVWYGAVIPYKDSRIGPQETHESGELVNYDGTTPSGAYSAESHIIDEYTIAIDFYTTGPIEKCFRYKVDTKPNESNTALVLNLQYTNLCSYRIIEDMERDAELNTILLELDEPIGDREVVLKNPKPQPAS